MRATLLGAILCAVLLAHAVAGSPTRIVVVGDLHGDMKQTLRVLKGSGVIASHPDFYGDKFGGAKRARTWFRDPVHHSRDMPVDPNTINRNMVYNKRGHLMAGARADTYHWSGEGATLVVAGDAMNVGPDDIDVLVLLKRLMGEAEEAGGRVVFLLGNHELQNLQGNYIGVHPWGFERSGGRDGRTHTLSMKAHVGRFLRSRPLMHVEDGLVFLHGGILPGTLDEFKRLGVNTSRSIAEVAHEVNRRARHALESWTSTPSGTPTGTVRDRVARFAINYEYAKHGEEKCLALIHPLDKCDGVEKANSMMGVEAQVVGHTPHALPKFSFCHGQLLAVDFQMSQWKAGEGAAVASLELVRAPRAHNHSHGPLRGALAWHTQLVMPSGSLADDEDGDGGDGGWPAYLGAVAVGVVAVEALLHLAKRMF